MSEYIPEQISFTSSVVYKQLASFDISEDHQLLEAGEVVIEEMLVALSESNFVAFQIKFFLIVRNQKRVTSCIVANSEY